MQVVLNILIALMPIVLICVFVYLKDGARPEKPKHLLFTFLLGAAFALPAYLLESQIDTLGWQHSVDFIPYTVYMFIGVALVEEVMKLLPVLIYPFRKAFFDEPLDGIVYCVFAAMGFAAVESVMYAPQLDWEGIWAKATLMVPAHAAFAMIAGYYMGRARIQSEKSSRNKFILTGLFWAIVAHGLYDWFIFNPYEPWLTLLSVVVLLACWMFALRLTAKHAKTSDPTPLASKSA